MAKKRKKTPERRKVSAGVTAATARRLDGEARRRSRGRGEEWTRADLVRLAIARLLEAELPDGEREALYRELLRTAGPLKLAAKGKLADGKPHLARPLYLRAAALELEALALLDDPGEDTLKSSLLEILVLLKNGTGYKHLPEVPGGRKTVRSFQ